MSRCEWLATDTLGTRWELWRRQPERRRFVGRVVRTPEGCYEYGFVRPLTRRWGFGREATLAQASRAVSRAAASARPLEPRSA